jgi:serine/threonine protein kinase
MKLCQSPYIIEMKDNCQVDSKIFLILEFCAGGDLEKVIKKNP